MPSLLFHKIPHICRFAGSRAILGFILLPSLGLAAQSSSPPSAAQTSPSPDQTIPPASCPIRVDEAYLTADPAAMPAEGTAVRRTLHATLVDSSGKRIVSYVVHARIDLMPNGTLTNAPQTGNIIRRWHGDLEPDTPTKQQWVFPANRFTLGLQRLWFDKVTFADGTVWNKSARDGCSFAATGRVVQTKALAKDH
jgi:hypothetical protein